MATCVHLLSCTRALVFACSRALIASAHAQMYPSTRRALLEFYAPFNDALAELLSDDAFRWADTISKYDVGAAIEPPLTASVVPAPRPPQMSSPSSVRRRHGSAGVVFVVAGALVWAVVLEYERRYHQGARVDEDTGVQA